MIAVLYCISDLSKLIQDLSNQWNGLDIYLYDAWELCWITKNRGEILVWLNQGFRFKIDLMHQMFNFSNVFKGLKLFWFFQYWVLAIKMLMKNIRLDIVFITIKIRSSSIFLQKTFDLTYQETLVQVFFQLNLVK